MSDQKSQAPEPKYQKTLPLKAQTPKNPEAST
jgi:hypothetical protein